MKFKCPHCNKFIELIVSNPENNIEDKIEKQNIIPILSKKKLYVSSMGLNLRSEPKLSNNVITVLKKNTEVKVLKENNKWYQVKAGDNIGWVSCYHLSENKETIIKKVKSVKSIDSKIPHLIVGSPNLANDVNTKKLRKIINYEFKFNYDKVDLQCTEYVQYRAQQLGTLIQWPVKAGRNGGNWGNIFEEHGPYKVSNEPSVGSAISFTTGFRTPQMNQIGHIAFVEQVLKDGFIKISEANWPPPGKYNERIVSKSEWKNKYKCKFIKII